MSAAEETSTVKRQELQHRRYIEVPADAWITDSAQTRANGCSRR